MGTVRQRRRRPAVPGPGGCQCGQILPVGASMARAGRNLIGTPLGHLSKHRSWEEAATLHVGRDLLQALQIGKKAQQELGSAASLGSKAPFSKAQALEHSTASLAPSPGKRTLQFL